MPFVDRVDAGRRLAARLDWLRGMDVVVLGVPRGGVPVAFEVAGALGAPLDLAVVRKLGVPIHPELAMGAIGEGGVRVMIDSVLQAAGIGPCEIAMVERGERAELDRQVRRYRHGRPGIPLDGRLAVVVDDGVATGACAAAACRVARAQGARAVALAVPVAARCALDQLRGEADAVVWVECPAPLLTVGRWYLDFAPVTDAEVTLLLDKASTRVP